MEPFELCTPVVFIIFNRMNTALRVFAEIRNARPKQLLLISDGPRESKEGERQAVSEVRDRILSLVDWPCDVQTNFAEENMGCRRRIISGLEWVFSRVESAIILEDDCLPEPTFFRYCQELLSFYKDDTRITHIGGTNFFPDMDYKASYTFSCFASLWGWATWRRAWSLYDGEMKDLPEILAAKSLKFTLPGPMERTMMYHFRETLDGSINTWDYQWNYMMYVNSQIGIMPDRNLINNIGYSEGATHTTIKKPDKIPSTVTPMDFPLVHPAHVLRDYAYDTRFVKEFPAMKWINRIKSRVPRRIKDPIKKLLGREP